MACNLPALSLCLTRGATIDLPIRLEGPEWRYVAITGIANTAPVAITAVAHDIPHRWRGVLVNIVGPDVLNSTRALSKLRDQDYYRYDVVDADTLAINDINAVAMPAYVSGGQIVIRAPLDLSDIVDARMQINDDLGVQLAYWDLASTNLEIDAANDALRIKLTAAACSALTWSAGVFDLELVTTTGRVIKPVSHLSTITVSVEQTTDHL